ncbi:hypothetical protein VTO42DRAFT_895 [Malbranchea cinnamomea]
MCSSQSPWAVDEKLAYGFAAVRIAGQTESDWCCACYELTFTSGPAQGKKWLFRRQIRAVILEAIISISLYLAVALVFSTAAQPNGTRPQMAGVTDMAGSGRIPAMSFLHLSSRDANGASTGSKTRTTRREFPLYCNNSVPPFCEMTETCG